jgi:hypothetical protein
MVYCATLSDALPEHQLALQAELFLVRRTKTKSRNYFQIFTIEQHLVK